MYKTHRKFCVDIKLGTWSPPHTQSVKSACLCKCFPINTASKCLKRNLLHKRSRSVLYIHVMRNSDRGWGWRWSGGSCKGRITSISDTSDTLWCGENATTQTCIGLVLKSAYKIRISFDMNSWEDFRSTNCSPPVSPRLSLPPYRPPSPEPSEDLRSPHFGVSCSL